MEYNLGLLILSLEIWFHEDMVVGRQRIHFHAARLDLLSKLKDVEYENLVKYRIAIVSWKDKYRIFRSNPN